MESEFEEFKIEAIEFLDTAESCLLSMDMGGSLAVNYDSVFRVFHNLKGGAGMLGLSDLQAHMHQVETLFQQYKGKTVIEKFEINFFLKAIDATRQLLDHENVNFDYSLLQPTQASEMCREEKIEQSIMQNIVDTKKKFKSPFILVGKDSQKLSLLSSVLTQLGIEVMQFSDLENALLAISEFKPMAVSMELSENLIENENAIEEIHKLDPSVTLTFISTRPNLNYVSELIQRGSIAFFEFPFNECQILSMLSFIERNFQFVSYSDQILRLVMFHFNEMDEYLNSAGKLDEREFLKQQYSALIGKLQ